MTAVSMLGMHRLLVFMHTPEDIFDGAYGYIMIICAGIFTQVLYNLVSSVLRGSWQQQDTAVFPDFGSRP